MIFPTSISLALVYSLLASTSTHAAPTCKLSTTTTTTGAAAPTTTTSPPINPTNSTQITAAQLLLIAPTSNNCSATADFASECRTASQAAPFINSAFSTFNVTTKGEKAALLSLMVFETGDFKFERNHFPAPGRPGQGTRDLMEFPFILAYALDTPSTAANATALVGTNATPSNDTMNAVLALVLPDDLSFASAAWFYKRSGSNHTGCSDDIVQGLQAGTEAGWEAYTTGCVGTAVTDDRKAVYELAIANLD